MDAYIVGVTEPDMIDVEIDDFLSPRAGVIEQAQQRIIPPTLRFLGIYMSKNMLNLFLFQIAQYTFGVTPERHSKNGLAVGEEAWIGGGKIPEESVNGCQPNIACAHSILSNTAEMFQKLPDNLLGDIVYRKVGTRFLALLSSE